MKKRFLNLLLVLVMVVCVLPMAANAATGNCDHTNNGTTTVQKIAAKAATCTETGYEDYYWCNGCDKVMRPNGTGDGYHAYGDVPVIPITHKYVNGVCTDCKDCENDHVSNKIVTKAKAATCDEPGYRYNVHQCKKCGIYFCNNKFKQKNEFDFNELPATGHDYNTDGVCANCGGTCEHDYEFEKRISVATCTEARVDEYKCKTCGATKTQENIHNPALGHSYAEKGTVTKAATCNEEGVREFKCTNSGCDEVKTETIQKRSHKFPAEGTITKAPTCQEEGVEEFACTRTGCNGTKTETVAKLTCNIKERAAVAPTCNDAGKTAGVTCGFCANGKRCAYCAEVCVAQTVVPALGHDQVLVKTNKKATCTKDGEGVYDCTRCGYDGVVKVITALGHDKKEDVFREATCTQIGAKLVECNNEGCGLFKLEKIAALGHTEEVIPAVAATCTATGLTEGKKCSVCNETLTAQTVTDMLAHDFSVDVAEKAATCTEDGYTAHKKCANCDATEGKEEIDTDGHNFVDYICTKCGVRDGSCEHEGASITVQDPTCEEDGLESFSCPTCGYAYVETLESTGHTEEVKSVAGTCTTKGKTWTECTVCGETTVAERETDFGGHNYVNHQCTVCGQTDPASVCSHTGGHSFHTNAATCSQSGSTIETCDDCGNVVDRVILPATGHNYDNGICSNCGRRDPNRLTNDFQDVYIVG